MLPLNTMVWRCVVIILALPSAMSSAVDAQDSTESEPVRTDHAHLRHHLEVGWNALGPGIEYRYQWFPSFSTDALTDLDVPRAAVGVTFSPLWIFFVKGVLGAGEYGKDTGIADGPPALHPTYLYGWDAGFHFPISPAKTRVYFVFAFGQLRFVQNHYHYNGGGFVVVPPPAPLYRTETRTAEVFSIGCGWSF